MAYSELIKNLDTIRAYVRSFYIYGFKGRGCLDGKSARTYDDAKRRLENYLSGYMSFRTDECGKVSFVSIDSRHTKRNPLFKIFTAKSFTDMDISLHFIVMDILSEKSCGVFARKTLSAILDEISARYLDGFSQELLPEESTLRKKLREYEKLGLVGSEKEGKTMMYYRKDDTDLSGLLDAVSFFSEIAPCGVLGSFMLDKTGDEVGGMFQFKHHYITSSIESDFVCTVFEAIREKRSLLVEQKRNTHGRVFRSEVVPMMIYESVQDGRMYLMAFRPKGKQFVAMRFDYIVSMKAGNVFGAFDGRAEEFSSIRKHIWGCAIRHGKNGKGAGATSHVMFRVRFSRGEEFILKRLEREKRCGTVTITDGQTAQFDADIFDPMEIVPWARTFISRIVEFKCDDIGVTRKFYKDIADMMSLYAGGGKED